MVLKYFKSKSICVFLIFVFLLQSCAVYQKTPVSIDEAVATKNKVLIVKTDNTKLKLKRIEQIDEKYFGVLKAEGNTVKVPLSETDVKTIQIINKSASTWGNIGIVVGSVFIVGIVILAISLKGGIMGDFTVPLN